MRSMASRLISSRTSFQRRSRSSMEKTALVHSGLHATATRLPPAYLGRVTMVARGQRLAPRRIAGTSNPPGRHAREDGVSELLEADCHWICRGGCAGPLRAVRDDREIVRSVGEAAHDRARAVDLGDEGVLPTSGG